MNPSVSAGSRLGVTSQNGALFFVGRQDADETIGHHLTFLDAYLHELQPELPVTADREASIHAAVVSFLARVRGLALNEFVGTSLERSSEARQLAAKCGEHYAYLREKCAEWRLGEPQDWSRGITVSAPLGGLWLPRWIVSANRHAAAQKVLRVVREIIDHIYAEIRAISPFFIAHFDSGLASPAASPEPDKWGSIDDHVPQAVSDLRTEACLPIIRPWFHRSLGVPGDIAEFGCFRGTLSIKLAFYLRSLRLPKKAYAFDTFEGFMIDDPDGDTVVGCYTDNDDAFSELQKWSRVLPLVPVKGDARETCRILAAPLSFVWLDLDMSLLLEPVLKHVLPLCSPETVIGLDDYDRRETPTVKPWADAAERDGRWKKLGDYPDQCIAFYGTP